MAVNIRGRVSVEKSLRSWRNKETYRRRKWKAARKGTAARAKWFGLLKTAKWYVARREGQLSKLTPAKPKIIDLGIEPRGKWGTTGPIRGVVGHYTGGPVDRDDADACAKWRAHSRQHDAQWGDKIGYHAGVTRNGTIVILRPAHMKGAHTAGQNTGHIGVVMHGTTGDKPTAAQQAAIRWYVANAHTSAMPERGRVSRDLRTVRWTGHNDWNPTACPGGFKTVYTTKGKKR